LTFIKKYYIIFIESEGKIMFDDFDIQIQSDEVASAFASWYREMENELWRECFDGEED
jgi:hypothetical protein